MKKIFLFPAIILCFSITYGQSEEITDQARKATEKMTTLYGLDAQQSLEMQKIQVRKYRNLSEIEGLKMTDSALYTQKMQALEYGTDMSVKRILKSDQLPTFNQKRAERRQAKAEFFQKMKMEGHSAGDIELKYWEEHMADF